MRIRKLSILRKAVAAMCVIAPLCGSAGVVHDVYCWWNYGEIFIDPQAVDFALSHNDIEYWKLLVDEQRCVGIDKPIEFQRPLHCDKDEMAWAGEYMHKWAMARCYSENTGDTLLHSAVLYQNSECVKLVLRAGADKNVRNKRGATPLDIALELGAHKIVDILQEADCL